VNVSGRNIRKPRKRLQAVLQWGQTAKKSLLENLMVSEPLIPSELLGPMHLGGFLY